MSADSVATLQRMADQVRHPDDSERRGHLDTWLEKSLTVLDARFERQATGRGGLGWDDLCGELPPSWRRALFGQHRANLPPEYDFKE